MAIFNKFQDFVEQLGLAVHNLSAHVLTVALTDTLPLNTQVSRNDTDHPPPTNTNGYPVGGENTTPTWAEAAGIAKLVCTDVVFTAAGGLLGPFRYPILYNNSATSPIDAVIGWWDYGASVTLNDTETFTVDFDPTLGVLTLQ